MIVVAALLHDVGHIMGMEAEVVNRPGLEGEEEPIFQSMAGCGVVGHEFIAADFLLALGLPVRVANLVRFHVPAKRYLCGRNPAYYEALSEASRTTLGFQGGPMTDEECAVFEREEDHANALLVRTCDEHAKEVSLVGQVQGFAYYAPMIDALVAAAALAPSSASAPPTPPLSTDEDGDGYPYLLTQLQRNAYARYGFLKLCNLLAFEGVAPTTLSEWCADIATWSAEVGQEAGTWLQHQELVDGQKVICRTENYVNSHEQLSKLVKTGLSSVVGQLLGQEATLFKDKVNYKQAGGGGFACHQDTPAYIGMATEHVTVMVAVDAATEENGCLQVALPPRRGTEPSSDASVSSAGCTSWLPGQVPLDATTGVITKEAQVDMQFAHIHCSPGDVLVFSGYLPHQSGSNNSSNARRAMFLTFNKQAEGDFHSDYYVQKHSGAHGFSASKTISFQQDFQGTVV